ncbi:unnamed protein product [Microthlaspi erraticum]|uniref:Uncharacterized protein n=1 Tax=Microthlaspi erraticum TaxID=1685480 RepID=A0A6D2JNJ0_9BRAS|nr:unnamed protein product [Microthlaspi erraticum]
MLQEYLRNQDESTKKMERRIDFIHESLGNKSEVLFKQVIKLDEDIKKLREDHDRSLNPKREEPTPNHPPFYCNAITRRSTTQVHEDNEEEEREYEEQLNDEDEEQSIDINASPKQSMDTPSPRDPRFSPRSQASTLPRLEAMQRPSPPTEEEDTWQYDPIDPNKISPMKLKEFNAKVKSLPFYVTFEEAWDKHGLVEFFFTTSENKEEIHQLFRKARFPLAPHAVNQPPSPPSSPPPQWYVNSISREKLAEFNQFVQTLPASMSFKQAWRHYPFTTFFHNCKETPEDIKSFLRKLKFSLPSRPSTRLKTQVNSLFPVK